MADYTHEGEQFQVEDVGDCAWKVSDGANTISITLHSGAGNYRVSAPGTGGYRVRTPEEAVRRACKTLIELGNTVSQEKACKDMSEFVKSL